ncbi:hypothetical protein ABXJ76_08395 [Methylobacter sp. G7]|uniref:hypothetical protein n=1 Tax=Methylobacter sp. G7 TaxID=3230117 RepID=UPI003D8086C4
MNKNLQLAEKYLSVLSQHDLANIYDGSPGYSAVFLPSVSESYFSSNIRTMIIGKETRGWYNNTCSGKLNQKFELDDVVTSQERHAKFLSEPHPRSKFFQFYRKACATLNGEKKCSGESIIWSNLMCVSHHSKSPVKSKSFDEVNTLSKKLLLAQIEVLQPELMLFVTGTSYDKYIREFFPNRVTIKVIKPRSLWHFDIDSAQCFRTSHPQWGKGEKYREQAMSLAMVEI